MDGRDGEPQGRHERKLFARIEGILPPAERPVAAALVFTGPGPHLAGLFEDMVGPRIAPGLFGQRKYFTLVLTDRRVILAENVGEDVPAHLRAQFDGTSALRSFSLTDGDTWVDVDGTKYWFWPEWTTQIRAMRHATTEA